MKYKFYYKTTAFDIWQLSMYSIYGSIVGVCNIIFTVMMLLLTTKFWVDVNNLLRVLLIIGICLFTVIQPLVVYTRAKRQASRISDDMEIGFDDNGISIKTKKQSSELTWNEVKGVIKKPTMIVIFSTNQHGFILNNRSLGNQREAFYDYVLSKI